jgi:hypothetical protein
MASFGPTKKTKKGTQLRKGGPGTEEYQKLLTDKMKEETAPSDFDEYLKEAYNTVAQMAIITERDDIIIYALRKGHPIDLIFLWYSAHRQKSLKMLRFLYSSNFIENYRRGGRYFVDCSKGALHLLDMESVINLVHYATDHDLQNILIEAFENGDMRTIRIVWDKRADLHFYESTKYALIIAAAKCESPTVTEFLLSDEFHRVYSGKELKPTIKEELGELNVYFEIVSMCDPPSLLDIIPFDRKKFGDYTLGAKRLIDCANTVEMGKYLVNRHGADTVFGLSLPVMYDIDRLIQLQKNVDLIEWVCRLPEMENHLMRFTNTDVFRRLKLDSLIHLRRQYAFNTCANTVIPKLYAKGLDDVADHIAKTFCGNHLNNNDDLGFVYASVIANCLERENVTIDRFYAALDCVDMRILKTFQSISELLLRAAFLHVKDQDIINTLIDELGDILDESYIIFLQDEFIAGHPLLSDDSANRFMYAHRPLMLLRSSREDHSTAEKSRRSLFLRSYKNERDTVWNAIESQNTERVICLLVQGYSIPRGIKKADVSEIMAKIILRPWSQETHALVSGPRMKIVIRAMYTVRSVQYGKGGGPLYMPLELWGLVGSFLSNEMYQPIKRHYNNAMSMLTIQLIREHLKKF